MSTLKDKNPNLDVESRRYQLLNIISCITNMPFNRCDAEIGKELDYCLKNNYNDRTVLGTCFARLWERYSIYGLAQIMNDLMDNQNEDDEDFSFE